MDSKDAGSENAGSTDPEKDVGAPLPFSETERAALCRLLLRSLRALAAAGEAEAACRLAGETCALLRHHDMKQWKRFNGLLHGIARDTGPVGN